VRAAGLDPLRSEQTELAELEPPEEDEKRYAELMEELESAISAAEDDPLSIVSGGSDNPFNTANRMARAYGFNECSEAL